MTFDGNTGKKAGVEVWRIEQMEPARQKEEDHGHFFGGDCYIVLHTYEKFSSLQYNLFFWLGAESSQDERGAVAYQTVALDDHLGGKPVQHREVMGHESQEFLSLFPNMQVMSGGIDSAFNHVDRDAYVARLFHIKGKRNVQARQVAAAVSSMNSGDVFVLDAGMKIFQWNGKEANKYEKFKALEITTNIKNNERGGKPTIIILEEGTSDDDDAFWSELSGSRSDVKTAEEGGVDGAKKTTPTKLYRVSDASGSLEVTLEAEGKVERDQLDTNDVFIADDGHQIFVWIGKGATKDERNKGMEYGEKFLVDQGRPDFTPISRVVENGETQGFKSLFFQWDRPQTITVDTPAAKKELAVADTSAMHQRRDAAEEKMADDGSGSVKVWRIENFAKEEVPQAQYGQFFMGDSYIVLYTYKKGTRDAYIIYFWQGRDSSSDEKATSALLAVEMDDELNGQPVQVRVVQGKEPNHFLSLFKGRMIVRAGGVASGFANRNDGDSFDQDGISLFHIKGTNANNTRAVQVEEKASSLNSGDCFVLLTNDTMTVWNGKGANDEEKATAATVADLLKNDTVATGGDSAPERTTVTVAEGEEPEEFWAAIGGKGEYANTVTLASGDHEPRLFQMSDVSGEFAVEEIFNFSQDDLVQEDVMLLDAYEEVFVWLGNSCTDDEKRLGLKSALQYVKTAPDGRPAGTPVFKVFAGFEPPNFTCHFFGWDDAAASDFSDPYQRKLAAANLEGTEQAGAAADDEQKSKPPMEKQASVVTEDDEDIAGPNYDKKYTYEELKNKTAQVADPANRHLYLSDEEFQSVFGMDLAAFNALKGWKQAELKKKHGLF